MKTIAVVGVPNTGKSSWIELLTGQPMQSANYSGVTVETKKVFFEWKKYKYCLIDVPGAHQMVYMKDEEKIAADVFAKEKVDLILQIINSTQLESSLGLTLELRHLQIPMICILNFKDEADKNKIHIDTIKLSRRLTLPILFGSAFNLDDRNRCMELVEQMPEHVVYRPLYNPETDQLFEKYALCHSMKKAILLFEQHYPELIQKERKQAIDSCMRFVNGSMFESNMKTCKIDELLIGTLMGRIVLIGIVIMGFLFFLFCGLSFSELVSYLIECLSQFLRSYGMNEGFFFSVVLTAFGSLLSFTPLYMILSLYLAVIEESGLMARFLIICERGMRAFHLNGKSLISIILAHGCNIPALVHASSIDEKALRKKLPLLLTMCSCSARLPVYLMFANHFFGKKAVFVTGLLMLIGVLCVLCFSELISLFSDKKINREDIVELPVYRKIKMIVLFRKVVQQSQSYIKKLCHVLLLVFAFVYLLQNLMINKISLYEWIAKGISIIFEPLGFGKNWIYVASLISGIVAKEAVAGTFTMLLQQSNMGWIVDYRINFIYLVFVSLTIPCVLTCHTIKHKFGMKMMIKSMLFSLLVSYGISWLLYQFIMLF